MIDTVKIYTAIDKKTYLKIKNNSIEKTSIDKSTGEIHYCITNGYLEGSYDNRLSVRVYDTDIFGFEHISLGKSKYSISIEGSLHKVLRGYNAFDGFYDFRFVVNWFIQATENTFDLLLPKFNHWFLARCDVAISFDLQDNKNVKKYINNLALCRFPRRNVKHYQDETFYCTGSTTTLKIYNKKLEFKKHDYKKMINKNFDCFDYMSKVEGLVRFECEVKKKKLQSLYDKKFIRVKKVKYDDLKEVWREEFMKLLKISDSDRYLVNKKEDIKERLQGVYNLRLSNLLFTFYVCLMSEGIDKVKTMYSKPTYYRYMKQLKEAGIDITQKYTLTLNENFVDFNPFTAKEVI